MSELPKIIFTKLQLRLEQPLSYKSAPTFQVSLLKPVTRGNFRKWLPQLNHPLLWILKSI
ncbi:hypothetical protein PGIGA_G00147220 [Pangasianodon gigas]|uniref:Uncharacterized protein n=1 Tax=Pangasianodon gigas TaxID=30993 RepID=A0ACC5XPQ7_PANGG|nr:hypothetical protein [Pangasianodon gigas]